MRSLQRREKVLLLLVAAGALAYALLRPSGGVAPVRTSRSEPLPPPLPRIALERVSAERPPNEAGRRDLFRFGSAHAAGPEVEEEPPEVMVPVPTPAPVVENVPLQPTPPPMNLKFLGSVENKAGVKVAVLLTDRKEVLTGQAGETVANRYRIARIGLESVDVEDVASGQSRRIPLKGQ